MTGAARDSGDHSETQRQGRLVSNAGPFAGPRSDGDGIPRKRKGAVVEAWGIEPCATSAHLGDDGTSARSGAEGAAQNDGETRGLRADVDPMLAGASREDGEMDMTALRSQLADLIMELFEAEIGEENWTPVDMRHDKRTGQILALFEEDGGAQEVVRIRVEHLPPTEPTE